MKKIKVNFNGLMTSLSTEKPNTRIFYKSAGEIIWLSLKEKGVPWTVSKANPPSGTAMANPGAVLRISSVPSLFRLIFSFHQLVCHE